jgi:hypothetical protein
MTKLSVARIFEVSQIATTKAYKDLSPFVDYVNSLADNLVRVLVNGIGLRDNLDCQILKLNMQDQVPQSVFVRRPPLAVYIGGQFPRKPFAYGVSWGVGNSGELILECRFDSPPPASIEVTFVIHFS